MPYHTTRSYQESLQTFLIFYSFSLLFLSPLSIERLLTDFCDVLYV